MKRVFFFFWSLVLYGSPLVAENWGPYQELSSIYIDRNNSFVFVAKSSDGKFEVNKNGEVLALSSTIPQIFNRSEDFSALVFSFSTEKDEFVFNQNKILGPYSSVRMVTASDFAQSRDLSRIAFVIGENERSFVISQYKDGEPEKFGPYIYVSDIKISDDGSSLAVSHITENDPTTLKPLEFFIELIRHEEDLKSIGPFQILDTNGKISLSRDGKDVLSGDVFSFPETNDKNRDQLINELKEKYVPESLRLGKNIRFMSALDLKEEAHTDESNYSNYKIGPKVFDEADTSFITLWQDEKGIFIAKIESEGAFKASQGTIKNKIRTLADQMADSESTEEMSQLSKLLSRELFRLQFLNERRIEQPQP